MKLVTEMKQKYQHLSMKQQLRDPYEPLPELNMPQMFTQKALSAFNAEALGININ